MRELSDGMSQTPFPVSSSTVEHSCYSCSGLKSAPRACSPSGPRRRGARTESESRDLKRGSGRGILETPDFLTRGTKSLVRPAGLSDGSVHVDEHSVELTQCSSLAI